MGCVLRRNCKRLLTCFTIQLLGLRPAETIWNNYLITLDLEPLRIPKVHMLNARIIVATRIGMGSGKFHIVRKTNFWFVKTKVRILLTMQETEE